MPRHQATPIRRGPACLWAMAGCRLGAFRAIAAIREQSELAGLKIQRVESKRVDEFANMSDEELEAYVNGDRSLEH